MHHTLEVMNVKRIWMWKGESKKINKCSSFPFRTVTCWHLTSQPITLGGANTGRAVWGERCRRLRGSAPQRATPTSLSWAASWTTSTLRLRTVAHRFLLLWVQVCNVTCRYCTYMYELATGPHRVTCLTAGSSLAQWDFVYVKGEYGRKEGDVFVSLQALFSI